METSLWEKFADVRGVKEYFRDSRTQITTPLDLSIAKAQVAGRRIFEVKYLDYTLFWRTLPVHRPHHLRGCATGRGAFFGEYAARRRRKGRIILPNV